MNHYHNSITQRGITIQQILKIDSKHKVDNNTLTSLELIHQQVDARAKHYRTTHDMIPNRILPYDSAYLTTVDGALTSQEKHTLENTWPTTIIEQYYMARWNCSLQQLTQHNWATYHTIYKASSPALQVYIIKLMTGWLPVRHHLNKMTTTKQTCPLCPADETIAHLFQCPHRTQWRNRFLQRTTTQLQKLKTPQEVIIKVTSHLHQILTDSDQIQHFQEFKIFAGLLPKQWSDQYT